MTPPSPDFAAGLAAIQDPDHWIEARQGLYDVWLNGHRHERVQRHRPIKHLFSQPTTHSYEQAQMDFRAEHPWFEYRTLNGPTHFPTLDSPEKVAAEIRAYVTAPFGARARCEDAQERDRERPHGEEAAQCGGAEPRTGNG